MRRVRGGRGGEKESRRRWGMSHRSQTHAQKVHQREQVFLPSWFCHGRRCPRLSPCRVYAMRARSAARQGACLSAMVVPRHVSGVHACHAMHVHTEKKAHAERYRRCRRRREATCVVQANAVPAPSMCQHAWSCPCPVLSESVLFVCFSVNTLGVGSGTMQQAGSARQAGRRESRSHTTILQ